MATGIIDTEKSKPHAPEGASRIGAPPVNGTGGERGSNTFGGTDDWNADYTPVDPANPIYGPAIGTVYHSTEGAVQSTRVSPGAREAASSVAGTLVPQLAVTASSLTPTAATSVTLTATAASGSTTLVSGTVTFKDDNTTLGTGTLANEVATYVVAGGFTAGSHKITASVPESAGFQAKTSAPVTIVAT